MPQATIYLDNAATSFPKPPGVAEVMIRFMTNVGASVGPALADVARGGELDRFAFNRRGIALDARQER